MSELHIRAMQLVHEFDTKMDQLKEASALQMLSFEKHAEWRDELVEWYKEEFYNMLEKEDVGE